MVALDRRAEDAFRRHVQVLEATKPEESPRQHTLPTEAFAGLIDVLDGRGDEGIERVRHALADARSREPAAPGHYGMLMRILLETCARADAAEAGLATADEMLGAGEGARLWESEARRQRAEFLAQLGAEPGEVAEELGRALDVADRQAARSLELRAAVSALRHRLQTGDRSGARNARDRLAAVLGGLPDGDGSRDRHEAEMLLRTA
jgi:adenylate cyclase